MEEKILIKSEMDKKVKATLLSILGACFAITFIILMVMISSKPEETVYRSYGYFGSYSYTMQYDNGFSAAFDGNKDTYIILFCVMCATFVAGIVASIIYWAHSRCQLIVTENNVKGRTYFGKEVVLPMHMISAYSTKKAFSVIAVATSSGMTKFSCIKNYAEIGEVLSQIINQKQNATATNAAPKAAENTQSDSMEALVKLKALLDQGIITQE